MGLSGVPRTYDLVPSHLTNILLKLSRETFECASPPRALPNHLPPTFATPLKAGKDSSCRDSFVRGRIIGMISLMAAASTGQCTRRGHESSQFHCQLDGQLQGLRSTNDNTDCLCRVAVLEQRLQAEDHTEGWAENTFTCAWGAVTCSESNYLKLTTLMDSH